MRKRVVTIITSASLLLVAAVMHLLYTQQIIYDSCIMPIVMLIWTAIYVFGSCVLQTFKHTNMALVLGVVVFFVLCTALFYSSSIVDFITFFICMALVIRKSNKICSCLEDCKRPLH